MLHQMAYWAAAAGVMSFASAFLLAKGFPASRVGVLLAAGNLLSCAVQPILADRADRAGGLAGMVAGLTGLSMGCFAALLFLPLSQGIFGLLYLLGIFTFDAMMPLMNALSVACNACGRAVNYGFCRGIGSLAFSFAALLIGEAIAAWGEDWMLWIVLALLGCNILITLGYPVLEQPERTEEQRVECCSIGVFFRRYRWYCLSLLGVMLLAMFHAMTENYLIEIFRPLGGDSSSVGVALFIATVAEMPVMLWFNAVRKRISDQTLLKLSGVFFLLKAVLFLWAPSVGAIYGIQVLQAVTYSFLSPTQVYYAGAKVAPADMVKGQAFITASYTLGCAMGNFMGGQLLEFFSLRTMLLSGVAMAAAGTAVLVMTVGKRDLEP